MAEQKEHGRIKRLETSLKLLCEGGIVPVSEVNS